MGGVSRPPMAMFAPTIKDRERLRITGEMAGHTDNFEAGTRFRLSELGKARNPKQAAKVGTVLRKARTRNQVIILFDGHTTPVTFHRTYIEPLPAGE